MNKPPRCTISVCPDDGNYTIYNIHGDGRNQWKKLKERNELIVKLRDSGTSAKYLSLMFKITKLRVWQILSRTRDSQ